MCCSGRFDGAIMDYRPGLYLYGFFLILREKMVVETLVYQNQGNGKSVGWYRPKECEAVELLPARPDSANVMPMCSN